MEKRILTYRKYMDELLKENKERDWEKLMEEHLVQVSFFQHERLVHLIVTVLFALMEVIAVCTTVAVFNPFLGILDILIMVLLIPYVRHYYILENEVQKMYGQYDVMLNKVHEAFRME